MGAGGAVLGAEGTVGVLKCWAEAWGEPVCGAGKAMGAPRAGLGAEGAVRGLLLRELCLGRGQQCPAGGQERVPVAFPWEECPGGLPMDSCELCGAGPLVWPGQWCPVTAEVLGSSWACCPTLPVS